MSKASITTLFIGACAALAAGMVVGIAALVIAIANGGVRIGGPDVITVDGAVLAGMFAWLVIASLLGGIGALAALASWIGALLNTVQLEDKTWFAVLLVLGLFSFGWLAMVAYVIAGPDATQRPEPAGQATPATGG